MTSDPPPVGFETENVSVKHWEAAAAACALAVPDGTPKMVVATEAASVDGPVMTNVWKSSRNCESVFFRRRKYEGLMTHLANRV